MNAPRRAQRRLTAEEHDVVRDVQTLNLHRMLHLGLVDPVPNPSPMSEDEGAWVRAHVWPGFLRLIDDGYAWGYWRWSMCERGTCRNCLARRCDLCVHRQKGHPDACDNQDAVHSHRGRMVATLILRPGGETCAWTCRCSCPKDSAPHPAPPRAPAPDRNQRPALPRQRDAAPAPDGQDTLPGL
ncbi:DUF6248 family natural product biosynthesis protein [Streptomyces sp. NBC_01304]|uniref:DUF6248 family natural product biosynthesis protein n=1 Tax=Streptomyces sp. NBC_01304 TaxID=2903818 RepID=UPI002E1136C2|nr:DUF6248 family natural product biosynthesis protein [Streptomyces sp. NBC_01304]